MPASYPLVPDVPLVDGGEWTGALAYFSLYAPVFDDQPQYLGHRNKIADNELSDQGTALKARFGAIENAFKVSVSSGLVLSIAAGTLVLPNGNTATLSSSLVSAPDNATSFVYIDSAGVVQVGIPTVTRLMLAQVITVGGQVSSLTDLRNAAIRPVQPIAASIKTFGGSSSTDKVCVNNEVLDQGIYYFRNFTVPAGISITVSKFARIFCSGTITIAGTVNVTTTSKGAVSYGAYGNIINVGGFPGSGLGAGNGIFGGDGYSFGAQAFGSGGACGIINGDNGTYGITGAAGNGGGGLWLEAAGSVGITGTINANGSDAEHASTGGSGSLRVAGSGGGSGGTLVVGSLVSITASAAAVINLRGGVGGNGTAQGSVTQATSGGGGGSGGQAVWMAPAINLTGATLNLQGGLGGSGVAGSVSTLAGAGGGGNGAAGGGGNSGLSGAGSPGQTGISLLRYFIPNGN